MSRLSGVCHGVELQWLGMPERRVTIGTVEGNPIPRAKVRFEMPQNQDTIESVSGPWHDGWYVVATQDTQMPRRCMVCGQEVSDLKCTPVRLPARAHGGIAAAAWLVQGTRIDIHHGRCADHRIPWRTYAGIIAGATSLVGIIGFATSMYVHKERFGTQESFFFGTFLGSLATAFYFAMTSLRIEKTDGTRIWIGGFGRGFRSKLPPFQKS